MPKRILRSFLYLDENNVDDYLAQLEGGILEGPYTVKDTSTGIKGGGAGVKAWVVEGNANRSSTASSEVSQTIRETFAAKFSRLYDLLKKDDMIQSLNGFDMAIYNQIEMGEIVEIRGIARLPQWEHLTRVVSGMSGLIDLVKIIGQEPFANSAESQAYEGFSTLIEKKAKEDAELIIAPIGSPTFKFVAKLDSTKVLRRKDEFEAEVTVLGKVHRKLDKRETIDIFRVAPRLNQLENLNRVQRRGVNQGKAKMPSTDTPLDEVIKYPAMQILPIAIFQ